MSESRAFEHYTVERMRSSGLETPPAARSLFRRGKRSEPPASEGVRILDRDGVVVWQQWSEPRAAEQQQAQIVEDLLAMSEVAFRVKWKLGE